jgi:hypothetical protein
MSDRYRKPPARTDVSAPVPPSREAEVRAQDADPSVIAVGIYDIDRAVEHFITEKVKPWVEHQGEVVKVPVMYANPEKWEAIQSRGYHRDEKNRIMLPLIAYRRDDVSERENLKYLRVRRDDVDNRYYFRRKYSGSNRYDQFSRLTNRAPLVEYYSVELPRFVSVNYTVVVWTNYLDQLNDLIAKFVHVDQQMGGDAYKFQMMLDGYDVEVVNETGSDRMAKATIRLHSNAYLVPKSIGTRVNMQKMFSYGVITFGVEAVTDVNRVGELMRRDVQPDIVITNYYLISEQDMHIMTENGLFQLETESTNV